MSDDRTAGPIRDDVWKSESLVSNFLSGVRGGIPHASAQLDIMLRVLAAVATERPMRNVLDLGSGDGLLGASVVQRFPEARATLVDFSEPMMAAARERFGQVRGDEGYHRFVLADFGEEGWERSVGETAPFDAVVSGFAIHHQPDSRKRAIYAEIYELLAPGGVFINIEHVQPATPWLGAIADDVMIDSIWAFHKRVGSKKDRDQVAREYVFRPDKAANILAPVEDQLSWLTAIGYTDVDCYFRVFELAVFGGRKPAGF